MGRAGSQGAKSRAFFGVGAHLGWERSGRVGAHFQSGKDDGDLVSGHWRPGASSSVMKCVIIMSGHGDDTFSVLEDGLIRQRQADGESQRRQRPRYWKGLRVRQLGRIAAPEQLVGLMGKRLDRRGRVG